VTGVVVMVLVAFLVLGGAVALIGHSTKSNPLLITGLVFVAAAVAFIVFDVFLLAVCLAGKGCI
jgi:hypothetical protein